MSSIVNNIYNWMSEIADKKPESFAEYFYPDIFDYVFPENYDDCAKFEDKDILSERMRNKLLKCRSEKEVKNWMDSVAGNIIMKIDTEQIISDCLTG